VIEENPYATPKTEVTDQPPPTLTDNPRPIPAAWEKMRIRYNIILLVAGLIVILIYVTQYQMPPFVGLVGAVFVAAIANVCYFLGTISESILSWITGKPELPLFRKFAYVLGVVGSLVLFALIAVADM